MKRESSNRIRWLMEDVVPPLVRDARLFAWLMKKAYGPIVDDLAAFRQRAHALTPDEYSDMYRRMPRIHEGTDNSVAILEAIAAAVVPGSVVDVGCGTGYTLAWLQQHLGMDSHRFSGVDFQIDEALRHAQPGIQFVQHDILELPFADQSFDTVVCTHTLEHILDVREAIAELRRICQRRLIIVVPREREGLYTFNPHFHFFPYTHSFLRVMIPVPAVYSIRDIGRDIIYVEDRPAK